MITVSEYEHQTDHPGRGNWVPRVEFVKTTDDDVEPVRLEENRDAARVLQL